MLSNSKSFSVNFESDSILQAENMGIETICIHVQMEVIMNSQN